MKPAEAYKKLSDLYNDWWEKSHKIRKVYIGRSDLHRPFDNFISDHKKEVEELKKIFIQDANLATDFSIRSGHR